MAKKKYMVTVCRTSYAFRTIEVEAESEKDAENKAIDEAGSLMFSEKSAEYSTDGAIKSSLLNDSTLKRLKV